MAKTYFAEAVKLNPDNVRALWGLYNVFYSIFLKIIYFIMFSMKHIQTASQLFQRETGQKKVDLSNLLAFTRENLARLYKKQKQVGVYFVFYLQINRYYRFMNFRQQKMVQRTKSRLRQLSHF